MEKMIEFENAADVPAGFSFQQLPEGVTLIQIVDPECALVEATEAGLVALSQIPKMIVRDQGSVETCDQLRPDLKFFE